MHSLRLGFQSVHCVVSSLFELFASFNRNSSFFFLLSCCSSKPHGDGWIGWTFPRFSCPYRLLIDAHHPTRRRDHVLQRQIQKHRRNERRKRGIPGGVGTHVRKPIRNEHQRKQRRQPLGGTGGSLRQVKTVDDSSHCFLSNIFQSLQTGKVSCCMTVWRSLLVGQDNDDSGVYHAEGHARRAQLLRHIHFLLRENSLGGERRCQRHINKNPVHPHARGSRKFHGRIRRL